MFKRGDIVEIFFDLPQHNETKFHPAIIISNDELHFTDDLYICVLMTNDTLTDLFSFKIDETMLEHKSILFNQVRCHLITYAQHKHFGTSRINHMKSIYVDRLVMQINKVALTK